MLRNRPAECMAAKVSNSSVNTADSECFKVPVGMTLTNRRWYDLDYRELPEVVTCIMQFVSRLEFTQLLDYDVTRLRRRTNCHRYLHRNHYYCLLFVKITVRLIIMNVCVYKQTESESDNSRSRRCAKCDITVMKSNWARHVRRAHSRDDGRGSKTSATTVSSDSSKSVGSSGRMSFAGKEFAVDRAVNKIFSLACQGLSHSALDLIVRDAVPQLTLSERHSAIFAAQAVIRRSRQEFRLVKQNLLSSAMFQRERRDAAIQTTTVDFEQRYTEQDIAQAVDLVMAEPDNLTEEVAAAAAENLLASPPVAAEATPTSGTISVVSHLPVLKDAQAVGVAASLVAGQDQSVRHGSVEDRRLVRGRSPRRETNNRDRSPRPGRPRSQHRSSHYDYERPRGQYHRRENRGVSRYVRDRVRPSSPVNYSRRPNSTTDDDPRVKALQESLTTFASAITSLFRQ